MAEVVAELPHVRQRESVLWYVGGLIEHGGARDCSRRSSARGVFSVGAEGGSLLVIAGEPTQNIHIAFSGDDDNVRRFHTDATAAGCRSNGDPVERPRYHDCYYAADVSTPTPTTSKSITPSDTSWVDLLALRLAASPR